jgi:hypothetical protein
MAKTDLRAGAENLLLNCGGLQKGDHLLVLREAPDQGYYDDAIVQAVVDCARDLKIETTVQIAPFDATSCDPSPELLEAMKRATRTLFLSRKGDQIRFNPDMEGIRPIMSYALDAEMLASGFGRASYSGFVALKNAVNAAFAAAHEIRVTCPLGTNFQGPGAAYPQSGADVCVDRFPMSVFAPVPSEGFSGVIVQDGFLVGTGSQFYAPYSCKLALPLEVHFENGTMTEFRGDEGDVQRARMHYEQVGEMFSLDPFTVHSWHAGIHPGCSYRLPASANFERWSGGAFGNPRILHIHTCGHYAPGEISLNVLDPTIRLDGVALWEDGVFYPDRLEGGAQILADLPCMREVFENPARDVGQSAFGRLAAE